MNTSSVLIIILEFLSGFGLFLYGIYLLGETLQLMAGDRLKSVLERTTNNPYKGVVVGTTITAILHSSSGTTELTISLVRSQIISFASSIGIILGANIGTTFTAFLTGLDMSKIAPILVGFCALIIFVSTNEKIKHLKSIFGLGLSS